MNVNDVLDIFGAWDGDMTVGVKNTSGEWLPIESIEWADTEPGPIICITPLCPASLENCEHNVIRASCPTCKSNELIRAAAPDLLNALMTLVDHAQERYPHFEDTRGKRDIAAGIAALKKAGCTCFDEGRSSTLPINPTCLLHGDRNANKPSKA